MEKIDNVLNIKIGTNTLSENGRLNFRAFDRIGSQILDLSDHDLSVNTVTSCGIVAGMMVAGLRNRPSVETQMPELQRLACLGWPRLLQTWDIYTADKNIGGLQLTRRELQKGSRELEEALKTIYTMLSHGDLPFINENDAITHEEIAFGDNDKLAATLSVEMQRSPLFGNLVGLVMLTTVDGLYEDKDDPSSLIRVVDDIDTIRHLAGTSENEDSRGGMASKLEAAEMLSSAGIKMWIANGREENAIRRAMIGEIGTYFVPKPKDNVE